MNSNLLNEQLANIAKGFAEDSDIVEDSNNSTTYLREAVYCFLSIQFIIFIKLCQVYIIFVHLVWCNICLYYKKR